MEKRAMNIRWEKKYCISNVKITEVRSLQQSLLSFLCNAFERNFSRLSYNMNSYLTYDVSLKFNVFPRYGNSLGIYQYSYLISFSFIYLLIQNNYLV